MMKPDSVSFEIDLRKILDLTLFSAIFAVTFFMHEGAIHRPALSFAAWVFTKFIFLSFSGTYSRFWRYTSLQDLKRTLSFVLVSDAAAIPMLVLVGFSLPESLAMASTALWALTLARVWKRVTFERQVEKEIKLHGKRTLIMGIGRQAHLFTHRAIKDSSLGFWPIGFIAHKKSSVGMTIEKVEVLGTLEEMKDLCTRFQVQEIVVSKDDFEGDDVTAMLSIARELKIRPRMLSGYGLESTDSKNYELFKDVNLEDLLSREKVVVDSQQISREIEGKTILVTGAGGSIGSELCRQITAMGPTKIILADHSEFNLYAIHKELCDRFPKFVQQIVPVLVDLKVKTDIELIFQQHSIDFVYHAAAYKHVHLVEMNPLISIQNNVAGTKNMLDVAQQFDVERFVLISSDKAVNPTSIMGSTKRVCELLTTAAALWTGKKYCSVRFGNVLGSSGSFIPLLKQQVRNGGPVTITDARMQRYFMTIPEAVSLVLEASRISSPGDINVLKMGEPIMIVDIAKKIMTLMGKSEHEVPIVFTGIRPGEKLYEELYLCGDEVQTHHKDIVVLPKGDAFKSDDMADVVDRIELMCDLAKANNISAVRILRHFVDEHKREAPAVQPGKEVA